MLIRKFSCSVIALIFSYLSMQGFISHAAGPEGEKEMVSKTIGKSSNKKPICKKVALLIKNGTIDKYMPEIENVTDITVYRNLDIDGDGIADKVAVDSGSEGSFLEIQLSGGGQYDMEPGGSIMILKIENKIYALITHWKWGEGPDNSRVDKIMGQDLYLLTKKGAELICQNFTRR